MQAADPGSITSTPKWSSKPHQGGSLSSQTGVSPGHGQVRPTSQNGHYNLNTHRKSLGQNPMPFHNKKKSIQIRNKKPSSQLTSCSGFTTALSSPLRIISPWARARTAWPGTPQSPKHHQEPPKQRQSTTLQGPERQDSVEGAGLVHSQSGLIPWRPLSSLSATNRHPGAQSQV